MSVQRKIPSFVQTNQTSVIEKDVSPGSSELPSIVSGMRQVCALASTLLGGVASTNSQVVSSTSSAPTANATSGAVRHDSGPTWYTWPSLGGMALGVFLMNF